MTLLVTLLPGTAHAAGNDPGPPWSPLAGGSEPALSYPMPGLSDSTGTMTLMSTPDAIVLPVDRIAAGGAHSLFLKEDGTVWAWGSNVYGQLGRGGNASHIPAQVAGLSGIKAIAAGSATSLALKEDGTVWAWGNNGNGQLGLPLSEIPFSQTPVQVAGLPAIKAISAGYRYCLALDENGYVWGWGDNMKGQLGQPAVESMPTPARMSTLSNIVAISAGYENSLALDADGTVWSWGSNYSGELGNGTFAPLSSNPVPNRVPLPLDATVAGIYAGLQNAMAFTQTGEVYGWGSNDQGALGTGVGTPKYSVPTPTLYSDIIGIGGTGAFYFGLKNDGTVWGTGYNSFLSRYINYGANPVQVPGLTNIIAISKAVGGNHTLAIDANGAVWAWGNNSHEECGLDTVGGEPTKIETAVMVQFPTGGISAASVTLVPPATGGTPQTAAQAQATTNHADYTVTGLTWNEAMTPGGKFKAEQVYTATITLTSKNGKKFQEAAFTPTVAGASWVGQTTTSGTETGNTVTFTVNFPRTAAAVIAGLSIAKQPSRLIYAAGENLDLAGLKVTLTYNDESTHTVGFAQFSNYNIMTDPPVRAVLNVLHHNQPVIVSCGSYPAYTDPMTVTAAAPGPFRIFTEIGEGTDGDDGDYNWGREAKLSRPYGMAMDTEGNLFISDDFSHRIRMVSTTNQIKYGISMTAGHIYTIAGTGVGGYSGDGGLAVNARLYYPRGVAADSQGNLYIADMQNNCIRMVAASNQTRYGIAMTAGHIYTIAGTGTAGYSGDGAQAVLAKLRHPFGVAIDNADNLLIADTDNHCIRKVDVNGIISTVAGTPEVMGFGGDGGLATASGARLQRPYALTVDDHGSLYIADAANSRIRMVAGIDHVGFGISMTQGHIYTLAGNGEQGYSGDGGAAIDAKLNYPDGLALGDDGSLYIAESYNNCVRKVEPSGVITTLAGRGPTLSGYSGDGGTHAEARLNGPLGVFWGYYGSLLIADSGNHVIRIISAVSQVVPSITEVTITGAAKYGETLTANVTYSAPPVVTPTLTYQWRRNGADIAGAGSSTYLITQEDIGSDISVIVTATHNATGQAYSTPTPRVQKADGPAAPAAPSLYRKTHNSVTLTANPAYEFSSDGGNTWQSSPIFSGLMEATTYTFVERFKETDTHKASPASAALSVTTHGAPSGPSTGGSYSPPPAPTYKADVQTGGLSDTLPVHVDGDASSAGFSIGSQQGNDIKEGESVVVTMPSIPNVEHFTLDITGNCLTASDNEGALTFTTGLGSVTLPSNMLANRDDIQGKTARLTVSRGDASALSQEVRKAIGDRPLLQLGLTLNGQRVEWNNPGAPVTITIPYTPTPEELANPEGILIWYIDGSGKAVPVPHGRYDPKTGTVTFTTTHFSQFAVVYQKVSFKDVSQGAWYYRAVSFIAAREITNGTGQGSYSPEAPITRGEFMVMLMCAYGLQPDMNPKDNFSDAGSTFYTGYLVAAKRLGITKGVGSNLFAPNKEITRQEMFTLIYNVLKILGRLPGSQGQAASGFYDQGFGSSVKSLSDFGDAEKIAPWAREAMAYLVGMGVIEGHAGLLNPTGTATRAEMAQVLYQLLIK